MDRGIRYICRACCIVFPDLEEALFHMSVFHKWRKLVVEATIAIMAPTNTLKIRDLEYLPHFKQEDVTIGEVKMSDIVHEQCHFCGKIVQDRYMEMDYHKGWHTVKSVNKYPFEERTFKFPEGIAYGIIICQDCNDKPTTKWIHQLRQEAVKRELRRTDKQIQKRLENSKRLQEEHSELLKIRRRLEEYLEVLSKDEKLESNWDDIKIPRRLTDY